MSDNEVLASIIAVDRTNQVRAISPKNFEKKHVEQIAQLIDTAVEVFKQQFNDKPSQSGEIEIDEINLTFGIDFQSNMGLTIASIFQTQVDAGSAFQVTIKLSKKE
jgi:hypothetical protein